MTSVESQAGSADAAGHRAFNGSWALTPRTEMVTGCDVTGLCMDGVSGGGRPSRDKRAQSQGQIPADFTCN